MYSVEEKRLHIQMMKGLLPFTVLSFLSKNPMHGYGVISKVRKVFGVYFGPSTVYPLLCALEKKGYIASAWNMSSERPRKIYHLTTEGQRLLATSEDSLNFFMQKIGMRQVEVKEVMSCEVAQK
jgi:DNA-binding PadR family transcriptional regulator